MWDTQRFSLDFIQYAFALQNNKQVWIEPCEMTGNPKAKAALKRFIADIENKEFSLIVLSYRYNEEIVQAIEGNYEFIKKIPENYGFIPSYQIYVPKGKLD